MSIVFVPPGQKVLDRSEEHSWLNCCRDVRHTVYLLCEDDRIKSRYFVYAVSWGQASNSALTVGLHCSILIDDEAEYDSVEDRFRQIVDDAVKARACLVK